MTGLAYVNVVDFDCLLTLSTIETSWLCLTLSGRDEPFSVLVNETAKQFSGQKKMARAIRECLLEEGYSTKRLTADDHVKEEAIQDRYSLRCAPQVLGPISDTLDLVRSWVECEINGVSDNPLIEADATGRDGRLMSGGNFYGGYLSQGMDYLKLSGAHMADLLDRQIAL